MDKLYGLVSFSLAHKFPCVQTIGGQAGRQAGRQADSQLKLLNLSSPKNEPYAIFSAIFTFTNIENVSSGRSIKSA